MKMNTRKMITMALLSAISLILIYLIRFPIFASAPFLKYDPGDIPIMIGTFIFGPISGLIITVIVSFIEWFTVGSSGWIGALMHILSAGSYVMSAGFVYSRKKTNKNAVIALVVGCVTMTAVMIFWNIIFTPIYMGVPRSAVFKILVPVIIPFNLIRSTVNSVIGFALFKALSPVIRKYTIDIDN